MDRRRSTPPSARDAADAILVARANESGNRAGSSSAASSSNQLQSKEYGPYFAIVGSNGKLKGSSIEDDPYVFRTIGRFWDGKQQQPRGQRFIRVMVVEIPWAKPLPDHVTGEP